MSEATCKTCPFWKGSGDEDGVSECRRSAPGAGVGYPDIFPDVHADDWCGEHPLRQRDRLAAMAMQGMMYPDRLIEAEVDADLARRAYEIADAMLAESGREPSRG